MKLHFIHCALVLGACMIACAHSACAPLEKTPHCCIAQTSVFCDSFVHRFPQLSIADKRRVARINEVDFGGNCKILLNYTILHATMPVLHSIVFMYGACGCWHDQQAYTHYKVYNRNPCGKSQRAMCMCSARTSMCKTLCRDATNDNARIARPSLPPARARGRGRRTHRRRTGLARVRARVQIAMHTHTSNGAHRARATYAAATTSKLRPYRSHLTNTGYI